MDNSLYEIIKNIQNGDNEKILDVIKKFKPLINKLNRKLSYEEAETDLIIAFIEMIKTINLDNFNAENEGEIISYINKVMKNKHIDLFRKHVQRHMETVELNLDTVIITEESNIELKIFIEDILSKLTEMQRIILKEKYIKDSSDIEIAEKLHITRQAVNKAKNKGLEKLREYIDVNFIAA